MSEPRAAWREAVLELADDQDGLVTTTQLRSLGVPASTVAGRLRQRGSWVRVLPGVLLVSGGRLDRDQRDRAAALYGGAGAVIGGLSALRRHGVRTAARADDSDPESSSAEVHVLVGHARHVPSSGFAVVTRTRRLPTAHPEHEVPIAPVGRALADVVRAATRGEIGRGRVTTNRIVDECLARGLTDIDELEAELRDGPRQGSAALRRVIVDHREVQPVTVRDLLEQVLGRAGMGSALWAPTIVDGFGEMIGRPMAWLDSVGMAIEYVHDDTMSVARQQRLAGAGVAVFPVIPRLLKADPEGQASLLRSAGQRAALIRPDVRVVA